MQGAGPHFDTCLLSPANGVGGGDGLRRNLFRPFCWFVCISISTPIDSSHLPPKNRREDFTYSKTRIDIQHNKLSESFSFVRPLGNLAICTLRQSRGQFPFVEFMSVRQRFSLPVFRRSPTRRGFLLNVNFPFYPASCVSAYCVRIDHQLTGWQIIKIFTDWIAVHSIQRLLAP